jgi:hypothetical protein
MLRTIILGGAGGVLWYAVAYLILSAAAPL